MKREDILTFSGRNVEVFIMPNAEKIAGVLHCNDDHVEIGGSLLAYPVIWGVRPVNPQVSAPVAEFCAPPAETSKPAAEEQPPSAADNYRKLAVKEFLSHLSKEIKVLSNTDPAKHLSYIQHKALLELSIGSFPQAVSSCNIGLAEAEVLGAKLPKGFEHYTVGMKRIKALSLHAMGSKKAVTLARELAALPEMNGDTAILAILGQDNHAKEDEGDKPPDLPVWEGISQVYSSIRSLIREKLPPALGVDPSELDDVLLREKLIPNPSLHSSFIETSIKNHIVSPDLLDVVSLETLGGIMGRWWESVFAGYFGGRPYYGWLNEKLSQLKAVRDTIAHAHAEYLSSDDIAHAENICGEINKCLGLPV